MRTCLQKSPKVPYLKFLWNWPNTSLLNTESRATWSVNVKLMIKGKYPGDIELEVTLNIGRLVCVVFHPTNTSMVLVDAASISISHKPGVKKSGSCAHQQTWTSSESPKLEVGDLPSNQSLLYTGFFPQSFIFRPSTRDRTGFLNVKYWVLDTSAWCIIISNPRPVSENAVG